MTDLPLLPEATEEAGEAAAADYERMRKDIEYLLLVLNKSLSKDESKDIGSLLAHNPMVSGALGRGKQADWSKQHGRAALSHLYGRLFSGDGPGDGPNAAALRSLWLAAISKLKPANAAAALINIINAEAPLHEKLDRVKEHIAKHYGEMSRPSQAASFFSLFSLLALWSHHEGEASGLADPQLLRDALGEGAERAGSLEAARQTLPLMIERFRQEAERIRAGQEKEGAGAAGSEGGPDGEAGGEPEAVPEEGPGEAPEEDPAEISGEGPEAPSEEGPGPGEGAGPQEDEDDTPALPEPGEARDDEEAGATEETAEEAAGEPPAGERLDDPVDVDRLAGMLQGGIGSAAPEETDDAGRRARKLAALPPIAASSEKLLGTIRLTNGLLNFHPFAEVKSDGLRPIGDEELKERFGPGRMIFFSAPPSKLKSLENRFWILDRGKAEIEHNIHPKTGNRNDFVPCRVEHAALLRSGAFAPAASMGIYPTVFPAEQDRSRLDFLAHMSVSNEPEGQEQARGMLAGVDVLLSSGGRYYGPVRLIAGQNQNLPFVNAKADKAAGTVAELTPPAGALVSMTVDLPQGKRTVTYLAEGFTSREADCLNDAQVLGRAVAEAARRPGVAGLLGLLAERGGAEDGPFAAGRAARLAALASDPAALDAHADLLRPLADKLAGGSKQTPGAFEVLVEAFERAAGAGLRGGKGGARGAKPETPDSVAVRELRQQMTAAKHEHRREIEALSKQLALAEQKLGMKVELDKLRRELAEAQECKQRIDEHVKGIDGFVREEVAKAREYAFDGFLSYKMMQAASAWAADNESDDLGHRVAQVNAVPAEPLAGEKLLDHLLDQVGRFRSYGDNTVINLFLNLGQNFLTVFSGDPGSGKTSICNILAHALGLTHFAHTLGSQRLGWEREYSPNRYVQVSVERGWTSKRDFLGYYNPLTKSFESFDARRYDAFRLLSEECVQGIAGFPFVMLLDEANLSPMEYYWADFMNIADDRTDQAYISLGDRKQYFIPETLRFVATINNDHTTEPLSPRLLDRAGVVTLPAAELRPGDLALRGNDPKIKHVGWPQFSALFAARDSDDLNNGTLALMDALYARVAEQHPAISPRARIAVLKAVAAGGRLYREEDGRRPEVIALDYAVAQRLLPKLEGSGEAYGAWLEALAGWLEDNGLAGSGRHVRGMVARGRHRMDAFGFF